VSQVQEAMQKKALLYDKSGEEHYNLISALHKSLRDSDPDGALYWLVRMLEAGEDPLYIARRMVRFASEDIGNADPRRFRWQFPVFRLFNLWVLRKANWRSCRSLFIWRVRQRATPFIPRMEGSGGCAERRCASGSSPHPERTHKTHERLGIRKRIQVRPQLSEAIVNQDHFPEKLRGRIYYRPTDRGREKEIKERLDTWRKFKTNQGKE